MEHAPRVGIMHRLANIDEPLQQPAEGQVPFRFRQSCRVKFLNRGVQTIPADEPHGIERPAVGVEPDVDVALRRNGTALALFSGSKSGLGGIRLSAGSVKGFTRARRVSGKGEEADFGAIASLGPSSEAVVWNRYVSGEPAGVIAAQIGKGPSVGEPELLSGAEPASSAQLEISADGTLVASWQSLRSYRLKAAVACRGEWFNDTETITKPLIANAITRAKVAVSGAGFGAALWSEPTSRGDLGLFGSRRTGDACETN